MTDITRNLLTGNSRLGIDQVKRGNWVSQNASPEECFGGLPYGMHDCVIA